MCSMKKDAKSGGLAGKMMPSKSMIKPYKSPPIPVKHTAICAVSYGRTSLPVMWQIIEEDCQPVISGKCSRELGIIDFHPTPPVFRPVNMISKNISCPTEYEAILAEHPKVFTGLGKLKDHEVVLHVNPEVKPVAQPPRTVPYHIEERVTKRFTHNEEEEEGDE